MRRFLLWTSCMMMALFAYAQEENNETLLFPQGKGEMRYQSYIDFNHHELSGLCLLKQNEQTVTGCLMNEFGIKAFDLVYQKDTRKLKLLNVLSFLNKWYIKRVLRADWKILLEAASAEAPLKGKRVLEQQEGGALQLKNEKYRITYRLVPMEPDKDE